MKFKIILGVLSIFFITLLFLSGCVQYDDEYVSETIDLLDENATIYYSAGINYKRKAARLASVEYSIEALSDSEIYIEIPQSVTSKSGNIYNIEGIGRTRQVHGPVDYFEISIKIKNGTKPLENLLLTVNVGDIPLDTFYWHEYVEVSFEETGEIVRIPQEEINFKLNKPAEYFLSFQYGHNRYESDDDFRKSKIFYEKIENGCFIGGEKVTIKLKHPDNRYERKVYIKNKLVEPQNTCDDYILYEFTMPYEKATLYIIDDECETNEN